MNAARPAQKAPAVKAAHPGPQVRTVDGQIVSLREMDAPTVRAVAESARQVGDTVTATRAEEWATRHDAWDDARAWQLPTEKIPDHLAAWNNAKDPVRRHSDVLDKAAKDEKTPADVRPILAEAALEMERTFVDGFRATIDDPFPRVAPPSV